MNLVRAYHRCVRICTVTGVLAYSVAAQNIGLALLAVSLMMVIWLWIAAHERGAGGDTARRAIAPRWVINLIVLLLTLNMVRQAFGGMLFPGASPVEDGGRDLIGILAQYMIWLQLVKMLEPRSPRDQAQLLALNAMLIIAAVLTSVTLGVGLMVMAYLPVFLLAVLLYQVFAGHERGVQAARKALGDTVSAFQRPLAAGPKALTHVRMTAAVCGAMILVLGIAVFIIMPRGVLKSFFADVQPPESGAVTGFTPEVQLGMAGRLSESREVVMELEVFLGGAPLVLTHKPYYLRGTSLDTYDPQTGVWRTLRDKPLYIRTGSALPSKDSQFASVEQKITLRNKVTDHLFAVWRPVHVAFAGGGSVRRSQTDETIRLEGRRGAFTYWVRSAPYDDLPEAEDARPAENAGPDAQRTAAHPFGPGSPIHALAQELVQRAGLERDREAVSDPADERIAGLFRDYLQNNYVYTTEMVAPRPGQDPIEMFLFETRRGHCEYFASAMAALCQSMGMRARVVTGFVASEYDEVQEKYLVRENNAHAWVEVLVNETRWRTYDPSPPDGLRLAHQPPDGLLSPLERLFDRLEMAWTTSVISFDNTSQARIFGQGSNAELPMPAFLERLTDYFGYGDSQKRPKVDPAELFRAASVAFVAVFSAVAGLLLLLNPLTSRLALRFPRLAILRTRRGAEARRGEHARDPDAARRREQQAFYRRMLHVLAHMRGGAFAKPGWRPPLEHARAISPSDAELGAAAARLSELYYRSRFGRMLLSAEELAAARESVAAIEQRLRSSSRKSGG